MPDANDLPHIDVTDVVEDMVTLSTDPTKIVAKITTNAYVQATLAAAVAVPLMAGPGVPSISNIPSRKPDENIPSQSRQPTAEPMRTLMVAASTASIISINVSDIIKVSESEAVTVKKTEKGDA